MSPAEERAVAMTETVASGVGLLAAVLGSVRADEDAANVARKALSSALPLIGDGEHVSTECRSCPVCRLLEIVRMVSPEVVDGLGEALDSLMLALRLELEVPPER